MFSNAFLCIVRVLYLFAIRKISQRISHILSWLAFQGFFDIFAVMTEMEKMRAGQMYCYSDPEVAANAERARRLCARLRCLSEYDKEYRPLLEELLPGIPSSSMVCPPFLCDYVGGIVLGENVFVNGGCTFLNAGEIRIGRNTLIGTDCRILTPEHPIDFAERREPKETPKPVSIGEDCWICAGVIICPGVTIGDRCIIAAGSVVTRDIPPDSLAAGVPAMVKKSLR